MFILKAITCLICDPISVWFLATAAFNWDNTRLINGKTLGCAISFEIGKAVCKIRQFFEYTWKTD